VNAIDLQVNGYAGTDFCSANLTAEEIHHGCQALEADGFSGILATLITDSVESLCAKLRNLVKLRSQDPIARRRILGFHVEGPFLNPSPGYIGAHEPQHVCQATPEAARQLIDAGDGLVKLVTLAPEKDPHAETTRYLASQGVRVAAGHCNPTLDELSAAIDAGLSMVTHFGNGCPVDLPRHDNVLQRFLHFRKDLFFSFIPDGYHVPFFALSNYIDLIGLDRITMTTDAITAAGLGPGLHELSGITVEVDVEGVARRPGSPNLAGSTLTLPKMLDCLKVGLGLSEEEIQLVLDENPRKLGFGYGFEKLLSPIMT
jgi:N-acetylglucosamine-6-phosphate deacetylase